MSKPQPFPFLKISQQHNVPYEDVLASADYMMDRAPTTPAIARCAGNAPLWYQISDAVDEFQAIRAGIVDWQTGEPTNVA